MEDCRQLYYSRVVKHSLNVTMPSKSSICLIENTGLSFLLLIVMIMPLNIMIPYLSVETVQTIVTLLKPRNSINAQIMDVQPQTGGSDCGIYCLSYCVSLACKTDPCLYVYRQNEMRKHLISCLENGILTEFPVLRKRRLTSSTRTEVKLFICPVCLKPDDGKVMVFCEQCEEWFHQDKCISPNDKIKEEADWFCERCRL